MFRQGREMHEARGTILKRVTCKGSNTNKLVFLLLFSPSTDRAAGGQETGKQVALRGKPADRQITNNTDSQKIKIIY